MRIGFVAAYGGGSARIRTYYPARVLQEQGYRIVHASTAWPDPSKVDVVVVHRPIAEDRVVWIERMLDAGVKVIIDEDDHLESVPDNGWAIPVTPEMLARHDASLALADGLFATTPFLEEAYGPRSKRSWLVPNYLPGFIHNIRLYGDRSTEPVRVGWAGVISTHFPDLMWIAPEARRMLAGAQLSWVGAWARPADPVITGLWRIHGGSETFGVTADDNELYQLMARADIGIVPLDPLQPLNLGKSWLKALEYMMLGKPVVVVALPEQMDLVDHGENGFVARTPEEFADFVQLLVHDRGLRLRMGEAAHQKTREMFLEDLAEKTWLYPMMELMEA